ncbi:hypothetical protein CU100_07295 [Phyllobacterium endophyticum]|uniref:Uncharacterized protein n=1 Tax=Phyllobacterium endophyticum TaxID=1149773 RepID=A0A2P7B216_9HYPH|nr:hypothetical protein CU100_07295 [Phyllobacterium endophyticum]
MQIWQSYITRDQTNALIAKNAAQYWPLLTFVTALTVLLLVLTVGMNAIWTDLPANRGLYVPGYCSRLPAPVRLFEL